LVYGGGDGVVVAWGTCSLPKVYRQTALWGCRIIRCRALPICGVWRAGRNDH